MQQPKIVYIDGFPIQDNHGGPWTPKLVDEAYIWLRNTGQIPGKRFELVPEWYPLDILGFPNYSVSKDGRLIRNGKESQEEGTRGSLNHDAYRFSMRNPLTNERQRIQAHLVIARMFLPPIPFAEQNDYILIHLDGNQKNNNVNNLRWVNIKFDAPLNFAQQPQLQPKKRERSRFILHQIDPGNHQIVHTWSSIAEAVKALALKKTDRSNISRAIRENTHAVGFAWRYGIEDLPGEEWKIVKGYPERKPFWVSNMGRIKTHKGRIELGFSGPYGYNIYRIKTKTKTKIWNPQTRTFETVTKRKSEPKRIDQLVWEAFHWELPGSLCLLYHKDDDVTNDKFENLDMELDFRVRDRVWSENAQNQLKIFQDDGLNTHLEFLYYD